MTRPLLLAGIMAALTGCATRSIHVAAPLPSAGLQPAYVDLQPGWRLRVITPLTKSGRYQLDLAQEGPAGGSTAVSVGDDFIGYEISLYFVERHGRDGVRIRFSSAQSVENGATTDRPQARLKLFEVPEPDRYVRLLYLARVSQSNHDMAVIASSQQELLASKTALIQSDSGACQSDSRAYCQWIPAGVAVRPEFLKDNTWQPAR